MDSFLSTSLLILALVLVAGCLRMSETAVISIRRSRVRQLTESGEGRALAVGRLQEEPDRYFATIQLTVTVIQAVAAALAGFLAVREVAPALHALLTRFDLPALLPYTRVASLVLVIAVFAYLMLVLAVRLPKSLGYHFSEPIALFLAGPSDRLMRLTTPIIHFLDASARPLLRLLRGGESEGSALSPEEISFLLREGKERGIYEPPEHELIHGVYEFTERVVREVMVPRPKIHAISADTPPEEIVQTMVRSGYSRYPVYNRSVDDAFGILYNKDVLEALARDEPIVVREMLHPVHFVPENKKVTQLLKEMQRRRLGMSLVVNEYGNVEGVVTMEDLLEEIVGEIQDEYDLEEKPVERLSDGSLLVDASQNLRDLKEDHALALEESPQYETLAGFVLARLERIPRGGEVIEEGGFRLTVVEMDGKRILRVKIEPAGSRSAAAVMPPPRPGGRGGA